MREPFPLQMLSRLSRTALLLVSLALVGIVAAIDTATGWELYFSFFYLLPIALVAWFAGRGAGLAFALLCALAWLVSDLKAGHVYARPGVALWNAAMQLGFFFVISLALSTLKRELDREKESARTDSLTGLANRRSFYEMATNEISRAARYSHTLTVAYLDIDGFKTVNDREGHEAGDHLLVAVANVIRNGVRSSDLVARLGGDEFVMLLPETGAAEADVLFSRIRSELGELARRGDCPVTLSIGAATFERAPRSADEMVKCADELMYSAKRKGGDRIERCRIGP